jgi:polyphosphate kinase
VTQFKDKLSFRFLQAGLTDWLLKDTLADYKTLGVQEIVVLPSDLRRVKQLVQETDMQIGCVVDFPLAQGTIAKKAFEIGHSFMDGADFLEVWLPASLLVDESRKADLEELMETSRSLALSGGEIRWAIHTEQMNELTKIQVAQQLKALDWPSVTLGQELGLTEALHDVSIFNLDGGSQLSIQVNTVIDNNQAAFEELLQAGVSKIGVPFTEIALILGE